MQPEGAVLLRKVPQSGIRRLIGGVGLLQLALKGHHVRAMPWKEIDLAMRTEVNVGLRELVKGRIARAQLAIDVHHGLQRSHKALLLIQRQLAYVFADSSP